MIDRSIYQRRPRNVLLSDAVVAACKLHSRKYSGCPRPDMGSLSHFVNVAVAHELARHGLDIRQWQSVPKQVRTN